MSFVLSEFFTSTEVTLEKNWQGLENHSYYAHLWWCYRETTKK